MQPEDEDKDKSLDFILSETLYDHNPYSSYFLKCTNSNDYQIFYGRLDVEQGFAETMDGHCEQCFNEQILWIKFCGDDKRCYVYLFGSCGLKKFNHFKEKNELPKILGNHVEIIDRII